MIKLIASDLDGTILRKSDTCVDPELIQTINLLGEQGVHFIAASGRPYGNLRSLFQDVTVPISFIGENGGVYVYNNKTYVSHYHDEEATKQLVLTVREDPDCELFYSCEETIYLENADRDLWTASGNRSGYNFTHVDDLLALNRIPVKLAIYSPKGIEFVEKKYKDMFSPTMNVITSGDLWLDFMPYGSNKGVALEHITKKLNIQPEDCVAFGDQWNDIEMLSFVGTSYAMSTCAPGISDRTTHTTDSVLKELKQLLNQAL